MNEDGSYSFTPTGSDVDAGDNLTYSAENLPDWASIDPATGAITGTPDNDDIGHSRALSSALVTALPLPACLRLTLQSPIPMTPLSLVKTGTASEGFAQIDAEQGLLANDSDVDMGDNLTVTLVSEPGLASNFTLNEDGSFNYRHNGSETHSDSFTYALSDSDVTLAATTVALTISPVNDAPSFTGDLEQTAYTQGDRLSYTPTINDLIVLLMWSSTLVRIG